MEIWKQQIWETTDIFQFGNQSGVEWFRNSV